MLRRDYCRSYLEIVPKTLDGKCAEIFRGHPFYEAPDVGQMLRRLLESADLKLTS